MKIFIRIITPAGESGWNAWQCKYTDIYSLAIITTYIMYLTSYYYRGGKEEGRVAYNIARNFVQLTPKL